MFLSCVNWRSLLLLRFLWRRGIFIGGWHCNEWTLALSHPLILLLLLYIRKNGKCQQPERPSETCCFSLPVRVSSCSWESVCWIDQSFIQNGQKKVARRMRERKEKKGEVGMHRGLQPNALNLLELWEKRRQKERWSEARQTQTWEHIPAPHRKIPASCRRVETDYTHRSTSTL